jgi:hypothetical protein
MMLKIMAGAVIVAGVVFLRYRRAVVRERERQQKADVQTLFGGRK